LKELTVARIERELGFNRKSAFIATDEFEIQLNSIIQTELTKRCDFSKGKSKREMWEVEAHFKSRVVALDFRVLIRVDLQISSINISTAVIT
jgi:hypothetical protein